MRDESLRFFFLIFCIQLIRSNNSILLINSMRSAKSSSLNGMQKKSLSLISVAMQHWMLMGTNIEIHFHDEINVKQKIVNFIRSMCVTKPQQCAVFQIVSIGTSICNHSWYSIWFSLSLFFTLLIHHHCYCCWCYGRLLFRARAKKRKEEKKSVLEHISKEC